MIAFLSRTGNIRYIVSKLKLPAVDIVAVEKLEERFLLFTYTDALGEVPPQVIEFMNLSGSLCQGVIVSGNKNFGHMLFGAAGEKISHRWGVPLIRKFDLRGSESDYLAVTDYYKEVFREKSVISF